MRISDWSSDVCSSDLNAAERALRGIALGRKSWLFAGSDRGGERAAFMYTLIATARLNDVDPQAWLADVLARIADLPQTRLAALLPSPWQAAQAAPPPCSAHPRRQSDRWRKRVLSSVDQGW